MKKVRAWSLRVRRACFCSLRKANILNFPVTGRFSIQGRRLNWNCRRKERNRFLPAFAAAALSLVFAFAWHFIRHCRPEAYLALDINPSIYFSLNGEGQVIKADPLNEEAHEILKGLQLQGKTSGKR